MSEVYIGHILLVKVVTSLQVSLTTYVPRNPPWPADPNSEIQTCKKMHTTTIFKGKTRKIDRSTSTNQRKFYRRKFHAIRSPCCTNTCGNIGVNFKRSLFSESTHIRNISFQEKMRAVIKHLLCTILVTRIAVYTMFNDLSIISVALRSRALSVVNISLVLSSAFAALLVGSLGSRLNFTTLQPNLQDSSYPTTVKSRNSSVFAV